MTKNLRLPDNVERLPHAQPATARNPKLAELGVAVHGQSFGERAESSNLVDGYPTKAAGLFNIGLLHTSLEGGEGHVAYAPCSLDDLKRKEYDYWALGHVHTRAVRCEAPYVVYPGNIQGRHIRETGSKGCYLVGLDDRGRCELEFVPLDVLRWEVCELDATPHSRPDDLCEAFAGWLQSKRQVHGGLPLCVRLVVTGASAVHGVLHADATRWTNEIRSVAAASSECPVWVEKVAWRTSAGHSRIDAEDTSGPMGLLSDYVAELLNDDVELKALAGGLADLRRKLPEALTVGDDALLMDGPDQMRQWIKQIEPLLLDRLREGSDA